MILLFSLCLECNFVEIATDFTCALHFLPFFWRGVTSKLTTFIQDFSFILPLLVVHSSKRWSRDFRVFPSIVGGNNPVKNKQTFFSFVFAFLVMLVTKPEKSGSSLSSRSRKSSPSPQFQESSGKVHIYSFHFLSNSQVCLACQDSRSSCLFSPFIFQIILNFNQIKFKTYICVTLNC